jgi:hypothetical protein
MQEIDMSGKGRNYRRLVSTDAGEIEFRLFCRHGSTRSRAAISRACLSLLHDHVRDVDGKKHDIVVLGHNVAQVRAQLEAYGLPGAVA